MALTRISRLLGRRAPVIRAVLPWLFSILAAASAQATTYYVGPGGSDSNAGTSPSSPWATLAKANANLHSGDVAIFANGTYAGDIKPANSGTATARITYIGNLG